MDDVHSLETRVNTIDEILGYVKNGVGDMKAEWLLIKREVSIRVYCALLKDIKTWHATFNEHRV